jgi:hypothetical protein
METLASRVAREGGLQEIDAVGWAIRVARSVERVHERGGVHGRLSADGVLIESGKCTTEGRLIPFAELPENIAYHSPERERGEGGSQADDTWAVAVTLYLALAGNLPFSGSTDDEVRRKIKTVPAPPLAVFDVGDDNLQAIVDRALSRNREGRTATLAALRHELEGWCPDVGLDGLPPLLGDDEPEEEVTMMMQGGSTGSSTVRDMINAAMNASSPRAAPASAPRPAPAPAPASSAIVPSPIVQITSALMPSPVMPTPAPPAVAAAPVAAAPPVASPTPAPFSAVSMPAPFPAVSPTPAPFPALSPTPAPFPAVSPTPASIPAPAPAQAPAPAARNPISIYPFEAAPPITSPPVTVPPAAPRRGMSMGGVALLVILLFLGSGVAAYLWSRSQTPAPPAPVPGTTELRGAAPSVTAEPPQPPAALPATAPAVASVSPAFATVHASLSIASSDAAACVVPLFPADSFDPATDFSFVCTETDPIKGAAAVRAQLVRARHNASEGMKEWALLGWYEMAAFSVVRARCCPSPPKLQLPEVISCAALPDLLDGIASTAKATTDPADKGLRHAVDALTTAIHCVVRSGAAVRYGRVGNPQGGEDTTLMHFLSRVVTSER